MRVEVCGDKLLHEVMSYFDNGAKLTRAEYVACTNDSNENDVMHARLFFIGEKKFSFEFEGVSCVHFVPIGIGDIYLKDISLGVMPGLIYWADSSSFNITNPDSSLTYVVAKKLFVNK